MNVLHTNLSMLDKINRAEEEKNGVHIYYMFTDLDKYITHATDFIINGFEKNEKIIFVDRQSVFQQVSERLIEKGYLSAKLNNIIFKKCNSFYTDEGFFNGDRNYENLYNVISPFLTKGKRVRTWGQVLCKKQNTLVYELKKYELKVNSLIKKHDLISICAYNGFTIPSYVQMEMMKIHPYFMTDEEFYVSPMYKEEAVQAISEEDKRRFVKVEKGHLELISENEQLIQANEIIAKKKLSYRKLIDELPIAIIITNPRKIIYANDKAVKKLEMENKASLIGLNANEFVPSEIKADNRNRYKQLLAGKTSFTEEVELVLQNGSKKSFMVKSMSTWFNGEEAILHVLVDLTNQKLTENLILRSEKLAIAGQLAAGIAHEIRNPLTSIKGFFKLIKNNDAKESFFQIIDDELSRIEQISSELLILAKPHSDKYCSYDITKLLDDIKMLLETQAILRGNEIITEYVQRPIHIRCEETKVKQVFINIIKNAIEATENGFIYIKVKNYSDKVRIIISDNGVGMAKEVLDKIGEPFFTTKERGTGLGFLICYKIIENHSGTIAIESKEGYGTTFTIEFPSVDE